MDIWQRENSRAPKSRLARPLAVCYSPAARFGLSDVQAPKRILLKMQRLTRIGWLYAAQLCLAASLVGCADGPIPEMGIMNPWVRKQWDADEAYGPTYHRRVTVLSRWRSQARTLPKPEQEKTSQELAQQFRDERSTAVRAEVLRTLSEFPTYEAQTTLLAAVNDADPKLRAIACGGLGRRQCPESLEALSTALGADTDLDVRLAAARALASFRGPAAAKALAVGLEDNDPALQAVAMESLQSVTGKDYGTSVATWREYLRGGDPPRPPGPSIAQRLYEYRFW